MSIFALIVLFFGFVNVVRLWRVERRRELGLCERCGQRPAEREYNNPLDPLRVCRDCERSLKPKWTVAPPLLVGTVLTFLGAPIGAIVALLLLGDFGSVREDGRALGVGALLGSLAAASVVWAWRPRAARR